MSTCNNNSFSDLFISSFFLVGRLERSSSVSEEVGGVITTAVRPRSRPEGRKQEPFPLLPPAEARRGATTVSLPPPLAEKRYATFFSIFFLHYFLFLYPNRAEGRQKEPFPLLPTRRGKAGSHPRFITTAASREKVGHILLSLLSRFFPQPV